MNQVTLHLYKIFEIKGNGYSILWRGYFEYKPLPFIKIFTLDK
jgi:hypothetical protein